MLTTRIIRPDQLTLEEIQKWRTIVRGNPSLCSPFFQPEFAQAVGRVNRDANVVVALEANQPVAFFPFQLADTGETAAIGESLNDFQGVISHPEDNITATRILEAANIKRLFCAKLLDWKSGFERDVLVTNPSPYVDLSDGYAAFKNGLNKTGTSQLKQLARKERKLVREHGPIRFDFHTDCRDILAKLIEWKRHQYSRTNERDSLASGWPVALLYDLLAAPTNNELQPALSTMYAGDCLVAAHYGLVSGHVCHWWFPTYNSEYSRYSPGKLMLLRLLMESANRGLTRFDFGAGNEDYKFYFANEADTVSRIIVDSNPARRWARVNWYRTRMTLKETSFGPHLKSLHQRLRQATATTTTRLNQVAPNGINAQLVNSIRQSQGLTGSTERTSSEPQIS